MSSANATVSIDGTFGCLMLGGLFAMSLWGAGTVQVYYYFDRYYFDSLYLKVQVFLVWALSTTHQALILGGTYKYLVTHYADVAHLATLESMLRVSIIIAGVIAIIVQSIFVDRIYLLSKKNMALAGVTAALALGQLVCTVVYFVKVHSASTFAELMAERDFVRAQNTVMTATNTFIAVTLVFLFQKTRTGFKKHDTIANKVAAFSINTGAVTALFALACLISSLASDDTFVYFLFFLVVVQLYVNSVMSSLNSRSLKNSGNTDSGNGTPGRNFRMTDIMDNRPEVSSYSIRPNLPPQIVSIKVDTETILDNHPYEGKNESDSEHYPYTSNPETAY